MHVVIRWRTDQREREKSCLRHERKKNNIGDGDREERSRESVLLRVLLSSTYCTSLEQALRYLLHLLNPHTKTKGCMEDIHISPSVLFFLFTLNYFSLNFSFYPSLTLALSYSLLHVFLIKSTINQIMLLYNKLQTCEQKKRDRDDGEKGGEEWSWIVAISPCRDWDMGRWLIILKWDILRV